MNDVPDRDSNRHSTVTRAMLAAGLAALVACSARNDAPDDARAVALSITPTGVPALTIARGETSTSGLSSGGFMAVQFHVAFSSKMVGAAIFAGGPYRCAEGSIASAVTRCMSSTSTLDVAPFVAATKDAAARGAIDPVSGLSHQRVFLFGGADDHTVDPSVMDGLDTYYRALVTDGSVTYERRHPGAAHTMPTVDYGGACDVTASPYVGACHYDGAGAALAAIYGPLAPKADTATGELVAIDQRRFVSDPAAHSLGDTAYAYVPKSCAAGETCRVHVAFHGCKQTTDDIGDAFYRHAGYNEWADGNHVVVLYPQAIATRGSNPNGCWDWFGYDRADYATRTGPQMATVNAMVEALANGAIDPAGDDAGRADASVVDAASGPTDAGATESACFVDTTAGHVAEGRAHVAWGWAFANGSNQALGTYGFFGAVGLARDAAGSWLIADCK